MSPAEKVVPFPADEGATASEEKAPVTIEAVVEKGTIEPVQTPETTPAEVPMTEPEAKAKPEPVRDGKVVTMPAPDVEPAAAPATEKKEKEPSIDEARAAYVKAHSDYAKKNPTRAGSILNIGGDISETSAAREAYDNAITKAAEKERGKDYEALSAEQKAMVNRDLFDKFVVEEEQKLNTLRAEELPQQEKTRVQKAWAWYAKQPRWKKIAISAAIGSGVAWGSGAVAGAGILAYAGQRVARSFVSGTMGAGASAGLEMSFGAWDKTKWGKKNTTEYQVQELVHGHADNIMNEFGSMRADYRDIVDKRTATEKRRMGWKVAAAALVGAGTSAAFGIEAAAHHVPGTAASAGAAGEHAPGATAHGAAAAHENIPPAHSAVEVHKGDSLWRITGEQLSKDNDSFRDLDAVQKTYIVSALTNQEAHAHIAGLEHPDDLTAGTKLDLSSVLNDKDHVAKLIEQAKHLTEAQRDNITANNHAITEWLHSNPNEHLTGGKVADIIHDREHPQMATESQIHVEHPGAEPAAFTGAQMEGIGGTQDLSATTGVFENHVNVALSTEGFTKELHAWTGGAGGRQIFDGWKHIENASPAQNHQFLAEIAKKVGDHHPRHIDMANHAAVERQMQDYLVSYPEAQRLGFSDYKSWEGVRDVPVKQFMHDTTIRPNGADMRSALKHSLFHRGTRIHEMANGKTVEAPLKEYHVTLRRALDLAGADSAPDNATIGAFMEEHGTVVSGHVDEALKMKDIISKSK